MFEAEEYSLQWKAYQVACVAGRGELSYGSIAQTFWWAITTITVVGYGEVFPQTLKGKIVGMATLSASILLLALPMSIIVNEFQSVYNELQTASPVDIDKLPLSARLRAKLRERWLERQQSAMVKLGQSKKMEPSSPEPASPVSSVDSADVGGNRAAREIGRMDPELKEFQRGLTVEHVEKKHAKGFGGGAGSGRTGARLRALEDRLDQTQELNSRALEVMRAVIALAAEAGEHAREVEMMERTAKYYEHHGGKKAPGPSSSKGIPDPEFEASPTPAPAESGGAESTSTRQGPSPDDDEPIVREIFRL
jgi:hypothetical protein